MAWNQPGGNGGRDPWGSRGGGQQGPPDLDEVLRKLQAQLNRFFGGRGRGGPPGSGMGFGGGLLGIGVIIAVLLGAWALSGFYIVNPAERGVVLRFGEYLRTANPGWGWAPRFIDSVEKVNVTEIRSQEIGFRSAGGTQTGVPHESLMLTEDENIIDIKFAVQYRVKDARAYLFNVLDPDLTLRQATESAVREIVGRSGMDFVITEGRGAVAAEAERLTQEILDRYETGLVLTSVNMQDAQPPAQVQDAFFDAVKAREDQERIINEANAYKAGVVPQARGEANAIVERAEAYRQRIIAQAEGETSRFLQILIEYQKAPEVTRERLYLETVESVMTNSSKVLVDVKDSNNLMFLPLDQLISRRGSVDVNEAGTGNPEDINRPRSGFDVMRRARDRNTERSR